MQKIYKSEAYSGKKNLSEKKIKSLGMTKGLKKRRKFFIKDQKKLWFGGIVRYKNGGEKLYWIKIQRVNMY